MIDLDEPRLTAMVAKMLHDKLPPIETWVGAILTSPVEGDEDDVVVDAPREQAIDVTKPWTESRRGAGAPGATGSTSSSRRSWSSASCR